VARAMSRQMSFADLELMQQNVRLEPLLEVISTFLDSQHEMIERVRRDLVGGLKQPGKGRSGLTAVQVLRSHRDGRARRRSLDPPTRQRWA
jgi:IS5 family transposase